MGLLSSYQQISTDAATLATDQGVVAQDQAKLATDQATVASDSTTVTADDTAFATALAAAPYNGLALVPDPSNPAGFLLAQTSPNAPGFTLAPVAVAS